MLDGRDREASEYIHKLAGIYRYMLRNEEEGTVTLRDEMTYVEMYRDLLKVRFQEGFAVKASERQRGLRRTDRDGEQQSDTESHRGAVQRIGSQLHTPTVQGSFRQGDRDHPY